MGRSAGGLMADSDTIPPCPNAEPEGGGSDIVTQQMLKFPSLCSFRKANKSSGGGLLTIHKSLYCQQDGIFAAQQTRNSL